MTSRIDRPNLPTVIEDREIWACANLLMKQHGFKARVLASQRATELYELRDFEGQRTFNRIVNRIRQLEDFEPIGRPN